LLPEKLVVAEGPSSLLTALNEQPENERYILHLLHYIPERRGQAFDIIEDIIPLFDTKISVQVPGNINSVKLVPAGETLEFSQDGNRVNFTIPKIEGHAMVEIS
jgi:hypothetical protein